MNRIKRFSLLSVIALAALSGCKKDDLTSDFKTSDPIQNGTAKIRFIHVAPELGGVSVKYKDNSVFGDSLRYSQNSGYTEVAIGSVDNGFNLDMIPVEDSAGIFTPNETGVVATLAQSNYILIKDQRYTCFIIDTVKDKPVLNDLSYDGFTKILTENYPATGTDSVWVRLFNASYSSAIVDIEFTNNTSGAVTTISNVSFMQVPVYAGAGSGDYNVAVKKFGITLASANNVNLQSGKAYTFYFRGVIGASGDTEPRLDYITNGE